jgi:hypothetical protein
LEGRILLIAIAAIIVLLVLLYFMRHGFSRTLIGNSKTSVTPRRFNAFTLRRITSTYGLNRQQGKLLEYVFRNDAVTDPEKVMKTPALLDRHFLRAFRTIVKNSTTDEDAQERFARLFSLRNAIEASEGIGEDAQPRLTENTPAILAVGKENYTVKIIISRGQSVVTEVPKNLLGSPIRIPKGTKITLSFFTKSSNGFIFDGNVIGVISTDFGPGLQITHSAKSKPLTKRKYRRRQIELRCEFYFVNMEESGKGRKKVSRLVVDSRRFAGVIQDLSAGGCSIKTSAPIQVGSRLKIAVDYDMDHPINVLGQVIRSNRSRAGTILHIKFLKVPTRSFNSINILVFGYNED